MAVTSAPETNGLETPQLRVSPDWRGIVARYQRPDVWRAIAQMGTTLIPLAAAFVLMYLSLSWSYWLTLALAIPTGGLIVRTFIIMHDCAHGSFLPWRRANDTIGFATGVLTLMPFSQWRRDHALHHASSGDLDRRGHGDVNTLTVREYLAKSPGDRLKYRLYRHPAVMLGLGPLHIMLGQRVPPRGEGADKRQNRSIWATNLAIVLVATAMSLLIGFPAVAMIYLPAYYLAAATGVWLFYVQHQFEDAYWEPHENWDYATAAINGASYFKLPAVLRWFTGNIGFHHVHHLGPRIPNYNLKQCHEENDLFHGATTLTLRRSIGMFRLTLWDEEQNRLIGFRELGKKN
jgi:omega-6 fatty acid desaturase (delta-12 desaturase)